MAKPLAGNNVSFSNVSFSSIAPQLSRDFEEEEADASLFLLEKDFFPFLVKPLEAEVEKKKSKLDLLTIVPLERSLLPKCTVLLPTISKTSFSLVFAAIYYQDVIRYMWFTCFQTSGKNFWVPFFAMPIKFHIVLFFWT